MAKTTTESFFSESKEQSQVKTAIVSKYFWAWAKVIVPWAKKESNKIAYIDLFAGPGRYADGTKSTPLLLLEEAAKKPEMQEMLVSIFNDADPSSSSSLEKEIKSLPGIDKFKFPPQVDNGEVGTEIVAQFQSMNLVPTLFFVDPWGYKGLSLQLVNSVLKDWGCDCIFFFNYNRINMGLSNPKVRAHMEALFGADRMKAIEPGLDALADAADRELYVIEQLASALSELGGKFVLPFTFKNEKGTRTSHHLIFVSKNIRGYEIMKEIMARESSSKDEGVASFAYSPADKRFPRLFALTRPLTDLKKELLSKFTGKTLSMIQIYDAHHVGTPYIKANYKEALRQLEEEGKLLVIPDAASRPKRKGVVTFADAVSVKFATTA